MTDDGTCGGTYTGADSYIVVSGSGVGGAVGKSECGCGGECGGSGKCGGGSALPMPSALPPGVVDVTPGRIISAGRPVRKVGVRSFARLPPGVRDVTPGRRDLPSRPWRYVDGTDCPDSWNRGERTVTPTTEQRRCISRAMIAATDEEGSSSDPCGSGDYETAWRDAFDRHNDCSLPPELVDAILDEARICHTEVGLHQCDGVPVDVTGCITLAVPGSIDVPYCEPPPLPFWDGGPSGGQRGGAPAGAPTVVAAPRSPSRRRSV